MGGTAGTTKTTLTQPAITVRSLPQASSGVRHLIPRFRRPNNSFKPTQLRGGNVLRLSRSYFAAAKPVGLTQVLGLARNFLGICGLCIELRLIGLLFGSSVPLRTWPTARRGPAHRGGGSIP